MKRHSLNWFVLNCLFCRKIKIVGHLSVKQLDHCNSELGSKMTSVIKLICPALLAIPTKLIRIFWSIFRASPLSDRVKDTEVGYFLLQLCFLDILKTAYSFNSYQLTVSVRFYLKIIIQNYHFSSYSMFGCTICSF